MSHFVLSIMLLATNCIKAASRGLTTVTSFGEERTHYENTPM